jgi:predicted nucleic acid-binding protein
MNKMRSLLIDTNIWSYLFHPKKYPQQYANIKDHLRNVSKSARLGVSVVTLGEIAVGLHNEQKDSVQKKHLVFVKSLNPWILDIGLHTAERYGTLRGRLKEKDSGNRSADALVDRLTWLEIGSMENDLWIVAQAITHDLILVTNDKLNWIREVAKDELHIENWAEGDIS